MGSRFWVLGFGFCSFRGAHISSRLWSFFFEGSRLHPTPHTHAFSHSQTLTPRHPVLSQGVGSGVGGLLLLELEKDFLGGEQAFQRLQPRPRVRPLVPDFVFWFWVDGRRPIANFTAICAGSALHAPTQYKFWRWRADPEKILKRPCSHPTTGKPPFLAFSPGPVSAPGYLISCFGFWVDGRRPIASLTAIFTGPALHVPT